MTAAGCLQNRGKIPGTITTRSIVATYILTPSEYIETTLFHIFVRGQEIRHEVSTPPQSYAVTVNGGRLQFQRSGLERRASVFEGNKFTATSGTSVDLWEKVD